MRCVSTLSPLAQSVWYTSFSWSHDIRRVFKPTHHYCPFSKNFQVHFVVADGEGNWNEETDGSIGFINKEILEKYLFVSTGKPASELSSNTETHGAFVCGPPPFMKFMSGDKEPDRSQGKVAGYLKDLGFSEENVYKF